MASKFETGHFVNLSNFGKLISYLYSLPNYAPDAVELRLPQLENLKTSLEAATQNLVTSAAMLQQNINDRQQLYTQTRKLAMRLMRYLEASSTDHEAIKDVKSHYKLLFAQKLTKISNVAEDGTVSEKTYSSNRLSFDSLAENFQKMYERISIMIDYAPTDNTLQIPNLQQKYQELLTTNTLLNNQYQAVYNARNTRDLLMYQKDTGLVDVAARVRKYVQYQYGFQSEAAQYVKNINFTRKQLRIAEGVSI